MLVEQAFTTAGTEITEGAQRVKLKGGQYCYEAWLGVLQRGDIRTMVNGFLNSTEYRLRFGQP